MEVDEILKVKMSEDEHNWPKVSESDANINIEMGKKSRRQLQSKRLLFLRII